MNKFTKMLALASLTSLAVLSACSDSESPDPTKAEQCATGLNADCLLGVWTFDGVKSIEKNAFYEGYDFTAAPGSIEFYYEVDRKNNKTPTFKFTWNATSPNAAQTDCNPVYGTWEVSAGTLSLNSTINNMCFSPKRATVEPKITNTGVKVELQLGKLWLTKNQFADQGIGEATQVYYTEVFSIPAGQPQK